MHGTDTDEETDSDEEIITIDEYLFSCSDSPFKYRTVIEKTKKEILYIKLKEYIKDDNINSLIYKCVILRKEMSIFFNSNIPPIITIDSNVFPLKYTIDFERIVDFLLKAGYNSFDFIENHGSKV
jgi:hypothetical protein